jgi:aspartokinase/homoserine dehydrogenase 2
MSVIAQAGAKGRQLHKFGGSSLADVKCYLRVAGIMTEYSQPGDMMVVSAAGSTTNQLISWLKLSQTDRLSAHQVQQSLRRYQSELIAGLLPADVADGLISALLTTLSVWLHCWTAALPMRCMPKWWATVKCGLRV